MKACRKLRRKIFRSCNYKSINISTFTQDIATHHRDIIAPISPSDMEKMVEEYDRILLGINDKHAPLKMESCKCKNELTMDDNRDHGGKEKELKI